MIKSVDPATLVGDAWMDDPVCRALFERGLLELDSALQPVHDALDASERLADGDWDLVVNCRDPA
ncbi:MAG: hypothetical protein V4481_01360 [Patescibacteria group bacterium]